MHETTIFIAKLASAYLVVSGLAFLLATDFYARMVRENASTDPVALNLSGMVHFLIGMSIMVSHFRWESVPEIVITVLGMATMAKGAGLIALPQLMLRASKTSETTLRFAGAAFIAAGAYLGYVGYL